MIDIGRRGFITGLTALVASPAIIRVSTVMPISMRHVPLFVPINWFADDVLFQLYGLKQIQSADVDKLIAEITGLKNFKQHAWPRPMGDNWVNINDLDPGYVRQWANRIDLESEMKFTRHQSWWGQDERASITGPEQDPLRV